MISFARNMSKCTYILFKSHGYATELATQIKEKIAEESSISIRNMADFDGINPQNDDIIIVDAHINGNMSDCNGIDIVTKMQKTCCRRNINVKFKVLSWFKKEKWLKENSKFDLLTKRKRLYTDKNVDFIQLPVNDPKDLTT